MNQSINIRNLALNILISVMEENEFSDKAIHKTLDKYDNMDKRDRAFLTRLCEGTIERCIELDYIINQYSKTKVNKMKPVIRNILRMGVYQIIYMEQVPNSAACNECVNLTIKRKIVPLKGFVNGVLRTIVREKERINYPSKKDFVKYLSVKYSMPQWIVIRFQQTYGNDITEKILKAYMENNKAISVRCNLSKASANEIGEMIKAEGADIAIGKLTDYSFYIQNYGRLTELDTFKKGFIQVQDESSMLVGRIMQPLKGNTIIDVCAAPGGKTLHAADMLAGSGKIIACDISENKTKLIRDNAVRNGFNNIDIVEHDALSFNKEWEETADIVIADLPCSGLGVIGKKCDIKYKTKEEDIIALSKLQKEILKNAVRYVKKGGKLIYSTCTIATEENEENVKWICENLSLNLKSIEENLPLALKNLTGKNGYIQILPYMAGTDGFFIAAFEKQ